MSRSHNWFTLGCLSFLFASFVLPLRAEPIKVDWPEPTQSARPWTRWWWHGSAVDNANLTRLLEEYQRVGLGGVEITCIYGVKGQAERNLPYRSDEWVAAVQHTLAEAQRLGLGVDLPAGSGWRMGGPNLPKELANSRLVLESKTVEGPARYETKFDKSTPEAVVARASDGRVEDLTDQIEGDTLKWDVPAGAWRIDSAAYRWSGDRVKRPAPGGAGLNINPIWKRSIDSFLTDFGQTLDRLPGIRAQFHDSFEYEGDWRPGFFEAFRARRGYPLEHYLPELAGDGDRDLVSRVKADYRVTLDEMVLDDFIQTWVDWSHDRGMLARNQSHGSPANWLDLYAACDIPEIETFGRLVGGDADPLVLKFASSAANVTGKKLVTAETATWLDEHFHVTLGDVRTIVDRLLLAGVNHVIYHGTAYSPEDATWPGWLFYASTQLNPQNPIWRDLPALNQYVTRCQSLLQESKPDGDVLLYWPMHDEWRDGEGLRKDIRVHNAPEWLLDRPIGAAAKALREHGYAFDYLSDRLLAECAATQDGAIKTAGGSYSVLVVPAAEHVPLATMEKLDELARFGCRIVFWKALPKSLPGLVGSQDYAAGQPSRERFKELTERLARSALVGDDFIEQLTEIGFRREAWATAANLEFLRRKLLVGTLYFLRNNSRETFDGWINPSAPGDAAVLLDPARGTIGRAAGRKTPTGRWEMRVRLAPGETCFLLMTKSDVDADDWHYLVPTNDPTELTGWRVEFIDGGPTLPESFTSPRDPQPWTAAPDPAAQAFAGTARYACTFDSPTGASSCLLELGEVHGSATVRFNGSEVATLVGPNFQVALRDVRSQENKLEIEVTGVAANRIRDLDRRGVEWRIFEDINLVNIRYRPFDASKWPVRPLGLLGPVTLSPLEEPE